MQTGNGKRMVRGNLDGYNIWVNVRVVMDSKQSKGIKKDQG